MRARGMIALCGMILLASAIVVDLWVVIRGNKPTVGSNDTSAMSLVATMNIVLKDVARGRRQVSADVEVDVRAVRPGIDIENLSARLDVPSAGVRRQMVASTGNFTREGETAAPDGRRFSYASNVFDVVLYTTEMTPPQMYPFDSLTMQLAPTVCVNAPQYVCAETGVNLRPEVKVDMADEFSKRYTISTSTTADTVVIRGRRPLFLRIVFVYFVLTAMLSLVYLRRTEAAEKLLANGLGTLAALWGFRQLLVPDVIDAYPTLVDYFVLASFAGVFAIVYYRLGGKGAYGV